jgi:hypothetical protein
MNLVLVGCSAPYGAEIRVFSRYLVCKCNPRLGEKTIPLILIYFTKPLRILTR